MLGNKAKRFKNAILKRPTISKIYSEELEKAKQYPIENLIPNKSNARRIGNILMVSCPFHQDDTPSFAIYTHNNSYYCFSCKKSGDSVSLYEKIYNVSFAIAVSELVQI